MRLDLRSYALTLRLEADATVQIMSHQSDDENDDAGSEKPVSDRGIERKFEDIKTNISVERLIINAETSAVAEQDPLLPFAGHPKSGE